MKQRNTMVKMVIDIDPKTDKILKYWAQLRGVSAKANAAEAIIEGYRPEMMRQILNFCREHKHLLYKRNKNVEYSTKHKQLVKDFYDGKMKVGQE